MEGVLEATELGKYPLDFSAVVEVGVFVEDMGKYLRSELVVAAMVSGEV